MKKKQLLLAVALIATAFGLHGAHAHALSIIDSRTDATLETSADADTDVRADADVDTDTQTSIDRSDIDLDSTAGAVFNLNRRDVESDTQGTANVNSSVDVGSNTNANVNGGADDADVSVNSGTTVRTDASANVSITENNISSEDDLRVFASQMINADANIEAVNFAEDRVEIVYKEHGRMLGFIPVEFNTTARVDAGGNVEINYPWYSFIVAKESVDELETEIRDAVSARVTINASERLTMEEQAQIVAELHRVIKARIGADADIDQNTDANVNASEDDVNSDVRSDTEANLDLEGRARTSY